MDGILSRIGDLGIVPVVKIDDARRAAPLARALKDGGLPVAEITFRTAAAEDAIKRIADDEPEVLLGAGTVLTIEQADAAIGAGARFIVAPGLNPAVVAHCQQRKVPVIPGVCTPSDIEAGLALGLEVLKFFPAEAFGGLKALKALSAPYAMVRFIPTGGVNADNLAAYLSFPKVLACGGSWMVAAELIAGGDFDRVAELTRHAVATARQARSG